jgi:hypothetical protein
LEALAQFQFSSISVVILPLKALRSTFPKISGFTVSPLFKSGRINSVEKEQRLHPADRFVDFPFLPAHSAQMYNLRLTSSVLKMEGTHYFIKGEEAKESSETKKHAQTLCKTY